MPSSRWFCEVAQRTRLGSRGQWDLGVRIVCKTPFEQDGYPAGSAARRPETIRLSRALLWLAAASSFLCCDAVRAAQGSPSLNEYAYPGDDLGSVYSPQAATIKVWAPTAKNVSVVLFGDAAGQDSVSIPMSRDSRASGLPSSKETRMESTTSSRLRTRGRERTRRRSIASMIPMPAIVPPIPAGR